MNKICNNKVPVKIGMDYNDKDYMYKINSTLKELSSKYVIALSEASNEKLFKIYKKNLEKIIEFQRNAFLIMFKNGWYSLESSKENDIIESYNQLQKEYENLFI